MSEYTYARIEVDDDGETVEKLAIEQAPREAIKSTHWGTVQYQPAYDDDFPEIDEFAWAVAMTEESFDAVERALNTVIPPEYKGWDANGQGTVTLERDPERNCFRVQADHYGVRTDAETLLKQAFSYENPDADFDPSARPVKYIYSNGSGPLGLTERAAEHLDAEGFTVEFAGPEDGAKGADVSSELSWNFEHSLRYYQNEAVTAAREDEQGVISLPTGTGKSVAALRLIERLGRRAIIFVHTKELLYQWAETIEDVLGVAPGVIGDDEWSEGPVTVAIMQSLTSRGLEGGPDDENEAIDPASYGVSIYDEAHRTTAAETFHAVGKLFPSHWRIGLTATDWRRVEAEKLWIEGTTGERVYHLSPEEAVRQGFLARPVFETLEHDGPERDNQEHYQTAYKRCIAESEERNRAIGKRAAEIAETGRQVIVNTRWIDPARHIAEYAREAGADAKAIHSESSDRDEDLEAFSDGEIDVVASTLLKEGVDLPEVNAIILAHGGKSSVETLQTIGRALRPSGGDDALVVDVKDNGYTFHSAHRDRMETMDEYYGAFGPNGEATGEDIIGNGPLATDGGEPDGEPEGEEIWSDLSDSEAVESAADLLEHMGEGWAVADKQEQLEALATRLREVDPGGD